MPVSLFEGQKEETGWVVGSLSGYVGAGCLSRRTLMLAGSAEEVSSDVLQDVTALFAFLARAVLCIAGARAYCSRFWRLPVKFLGPMR